MLFAFMADICNQIVFLFEIHLNNKIKVHSDKSRLLRGKRTMVGFFSTKKLFLTNLNDNISMNYLLK